MVRLHKKEQVSAKPDWAAFYQQNFLLAIRNWELNRQEDQLSKLKAVVIRK
ncbi:MAG: hypothetical protein OJF59_003104 [Cytophagales bacterium]|jgi:hypothetical protein|nr:hypothetical protein [Bacteroidota bacterium]MBS1981329.1 hypothetical protein [Bacteroidota bacterium]WHZ09348.1 MAG: hypothetical protein OJF59_003104 [Cytophagales bacterium]